MMRIDRWWLPAVLLLLRRRQGMAVVPPSAPRHRRVRHRADWPLGGDASSSSGALPRVDAWTGDPTQAKPTPRERYPSSAALVNGDRSGRQRAATASAASTGASRPLRKQPLDRSFCTAPSLIPMDSFEEKD